MIPIRHLTLELEGSAGSNITELCRELVIAADRFGITVTCPCNGVLIIASPGDTADQIESTYNKVLRYRNRTGPAWS